MSLLKTYVQVALAIPNDEEETSFTYLPATSAVMIYAVDELPICTLEIPLGQSVRRQAVFADPVGVIDLAKTSRQKVYVLARLRGQQTPVRDWGRESHIVIFEGRMVQSPGVITPNTASLSLTLQHWSYDLMDSSILLEWTHPLHANNISLMQTAYDVAPFGDARATVTGIQRFSKQFRISERSLSKDVWGDGIQPFVGDILLRNPEIYPNICRGGGAEVSTVNVPKASVVAAWRRIEGNPDRGVAPRSAWAVPLSLPPGAENLAIRSAVLQLIANDEVLPYASMDAWSHIFMNKGRQLDFMFVPRIRSAIVAPRFEIAANHFPIVFRDNDIVQLENNITATKPLRGIGVYTHTQSRFNRGQSPEVQSACYIPEQDQMTAEHAKIGRFEYRQAPPWINGDIPWASLRTPANKSPGGPNNPGKPADAAAAQETAQLENTLRDHARQYAKLLYGRSQSAGRKVKIVSRLRFDVAPGAQLRVETDLAGKGASAQFARWTQDKVLQGFVSRMTIYIDAKNLNAASVYELNHTRFGDEIERDGWSLNNHPLYMQTFTGATLTNRIPFN